MDYAVIELYDWTYEYNREAYIIFMYVVEIQYANVWISVKI